jgi:hypothetical protein
MIDLKSPGRRLQDVPFVVDRPIIMLPTNGDRPARTDLITALDLPQHRSS